jgi:Xaa-Pro aminopeptidase
MKIAAAEFARRRKALVRLMGRDARHAIAIVAAAPVRHRNADVEYAYRQGSDFWYLTGFPEPAAVAVLMPGRPQGEYLLFVRDRDPERELWDGSRAGIDGAVERFGADDAFPIEDLDEILPGLLESRTRVYATMGRDPEFDQRLFGWVNGLKARPQAGRHAPHEFVALEHLLHDLRLYKSRPELDAMRHSAGIAMAAHRRAMRATRPGGSEHEIAAELLHEFHRNRAEASYLPIVGGGANACVLHYRANDAALRDGDLLLIDAGAEYDGYASDITRTFPVNGRFTPTQRAVYEVVLEAQAAAIDRCRPGNHWNDPHDAAVRTITQGLVKLGLLKGRVPTLIREGAYREWFMHRTGHWLGLDVHDVGDYKVGDEWRVLEPGMVLTVEPGLYVAPGTRAPKKFQGIGIRIEDDVAITRGAPEVLTGDLVKDPDGIEQWMAAS